MHEESSFKNTYTDSSSCEAHKDGHIELPKLSPSPFATQTEKIEEIQVEPVITLEGHTSRVWCVAWHPTLNILASASADTTVKLWTLEADYICKEDANANASVMTNLNNKHDNANGEFCTAGKWQNNKPCTRDNNMELAAVTSTNNSYINNNISDKQTTSTQFNTTNKNKGEVIGETVRCITTTITEENPISSNTSNESHWHCVCTLSGEHTRTIRHVSWSPSGNYLACASFDHTVSVWQRVYEDGELSLSYEVEGILDGHESEVKCVAWGSDSILASCARDHNVWIWERVEEGEYECAGILTGHLQDIKHCLWEPQHDMASHQRVLSCSYDNTIKVWSDSSIRQEDWHCMQTMKKHTGTVWAAAFQKATLLTSNHNTSNTPKASTNTCNAMTCEVKTNTTPPSFTSVQHDNEMEHQTESFPLLCTCSDDLSLLFWRRRVSDDKYEHVASCSGFCTRSIFAIDWSIHLPSLLAAVSGDNSITLLCAYEDKQLHSHVENVQANANITVSTGVSNNNYNNHDSNDDTSNGCSGDDNHRHDDNGASQTKLQSFKKLVHVDQLFHLENAHDADVNSVSFANTMNSTHCKKDNNNWGNVYTEEEQKAVNTTSLLMATGGDDHKVKLWRVNVTNN